MNEDEAVALYEDIHGNEEFLIDGIYESGGVYTFDVWDRILLETFGVASRQEWEQQRAKQLKKRLKRLVD